MSISIKTSIELAPNLASGRAESYIADGVGYIFASARKYIDFMKHPVSYQFMPSYHASSISYLTPLTYLASVTITSRVNRHLL